MPLELLIGTMVKIAQKTLQHTPQPAEIGNSLVGTDAVNIDTGGDNGRPKRKPQHQRDPEQDQAVCIVDDLQRDQQDGGQQEERDQVRHLRRGDSVGAGEGGEGLDDVGVQVD